uniref:ghrelin O-acyltransferase n=1 Tax=Gasterosteus aculeatus aculeatus TaxID=481459 RepID=UPI001A994F34|nr:ghrelin O-acyltransferase [Gasterosteus aculeatus aculeatus]
MGLMSSFWERHQFLMHQCFSLPFAFLFFFLAKRGYLSLTYRYLFVSAGGCVLAVVTMGVYSSLLFASALVFVLLVVSVDAGRVHAWVFGIQMLWQTFWHLLIQYREYYLQEPVSLRLFLAVSSLMLLTQRITSLSMDLQERRVRPPAAAAPQQEARAALLPLVSYILNFTTLLGGPLCPYGRFVSLMTGISADPPPEPLRAVFLKLTQVLPMELVRCLLVHLLNACDPSASGPLCGAAWVLALGAVLRIQYYSHWRCSECLNNAAGLGFWPRCPGDPPGWSGLSDGDFWSVEASSRMSQFARRWNATTASWLRRLVYARCKRFPLLATFSFSLWWHGCHLGHLVGMLTWAATVTADRHAHGLLQPKLSPAWRKVYACLSWINTQMNVACIVTAVELRSVSGLRLLSTTYVGLVPLFNILLLLILLKHNTV